MIIIKKDGRKEEFDPNKILNKIKDAAYGLEVDFNTVFIQLMDGLYDGIHSSDIDMLAANIAAQYITTHPDYDVLASRLVISRIIKQTPDTFEEALECLNNVIKYDSLWLYYKNSDTIEKVLKETEYLNYNFDYFGINTALKMYLLKNDSQVIERPTYMYMRVALALANNIEEALDFYYKLANHKISVATPILLSAGTTNQNMISCNLSMLSDDSLEGIIDTIYKTSRASADGAGIGLYIGNLRSSKSKIGSTGGNAAGVVKVAKMVNEAMKTFNQRGKRNGSAALYLDIWHKDIIEFLQLRLAIGNEDLRARDIFLAVSIPDNFMKALENNEDYYLFCPHEVYKKTGKKIYELYGDEFEELYNHCKDLGIGTQIKAHEIWINIIRSQSESGLPYVYYVDNANRFSNHNHYGKIKASNLCAEIVQFQSNDITAQCCLGAIPIGKYDNLNDVPDAVHSLTKLLNNVIDKNHYSTECAELGGYQQRAIAIGVVGLADYCYKNDMTYLSNEFKEFNKELSKTIFISALEASNQIAKETGKKYYDFERSHYANGEFKCEIPEQLKNDIKEYGLANSLFTALMPTASTAQLLSLGESFEPYTRNLFVRKTLTGEFLVINKHLVNDFIKYGLWNEDVRKHLLLNNGSIMNLNIEHDAIKHLKEKYLTIYEISQKVLIDLASDRMPYIDQSQSMNLYINKPDASVISSMLMYAYKKGLTTGCYYIRTAPKTEANKSLAIKEIKQVVKNEDVSCFGCNL